MGKCSNCEKWNYTTFTEKTYGMGVGICLADGSQTFCDHECPFCIEIEEQED